MKSLVNLVPLPGISEFGNVVRSLIRCSKDLSQTSDKQDALIRRLEGLTSCAKHLEDLSELNSQLLEIKSQLEVTLKSSSRSRLFQAQRKLAAWEELNLKVDRVVELTLLRLAAQSLNTQVEQNPSPWIANQLPVIPRYEITDQVEIPRRSDYSRELSSHSISSYEPITSSCRFGQWGKLSVTYKTIASRSDSAVSHLVEEEINYVSRSLHQHVAVVAGVTQGYGGLNGFVVVTDGIPIDQFVIRINSGSVWAKCIQGLQSFYDAHDIHWAESITAKPNGHVTVFPSEKLSSLTASPIMLDKYAVPGQRDEISPVVTLLQSIYFNNQCHLEKQRLQEFMDSCRSLGPGTTELQVVKTAASSKAFPPSTWRSGSWHGINGAPTFTLYAGELGMFISEDSPFDKCWRSLDTIRAVKYQHTALCYYADERWIYYPLQPEEEGWLSYDLSDLFFSGSGEKTIEIGVYPQLLDHCWADVLMEARQLSEHHDIPLESLSLCEPFETSVTMRHSSDPTKITPNETVYFHWNPHSRDPFEFWGFFSPSRNPDCRNSRTIFEEQGWVSDCHGHFSAFNVSHDWSRRYQKMLESGVATIPGSYPGVHIGDISSA
ncbi:hypothetical protein BDV93DRAFT_610103 [Ceratobasidium sp. AG-I]|nr:hypothetical protein BDV93DRAFT_610103 [Ceratobasidium sp. AG-I]